jgi:hypothetical protein
MFKDILKIFDDFMSEPEELKNPEDQLTTDEAEKDQWNTGKKTDIWDTGQGNNAGTPGDVWTTNPDPDGNDPKMKDPHDPVGTPGPLNKAPEPDVTREPETTIEEVEKERDDDYGIMDDPLDDMGVEDEEEETGVSGGLFDDLLA